MTTLDSPFLTTLLTGSLERKREKEPCTFLVSPFLGFLHFFMISPALVYKGNTSFGKAHQREKHKEKRSGARIWRTCFAVNWVIL